jgi:hypothetical protein
MLVTLDEMKTYLGIDLIDATYDTFLTEQINIISAAIENYCGRKFNEGSYTQTYYRSDFYDGDFIDGLFLYHYPLTTITSVKEIERSNAVDTETVLTAEDYRAHYESGQFRRIRNGVVSTWFSYLSTNSRIEIAYDAGYATVPYELMSVTYSLVEERYNKRVNGVELNFGNDVQRVSIPGTISIDYDYSLQTNERKTKFGMLIGNYANVLDFYRSERSVVGTIKDNYVV